jgi:NAD+ diphosphatase
MLDGFDFRLCETGAWNKAYFFVYQGNNLLWSGNPGIPDPVSRKLWQQSILSALPCFYFGSYQGLPCFAVNYESEAALPEGTEWIGLRSILVEQEAPFFTMAGRGKQILEFNLANRFCGKCGHPTSSHAHEIALHCPGCSHVMYPHVSPCMIVLVTRGEELLLARSARFPNAMYSTLAGFIEPGETIEQAVHREVAEEVGVSIRTPRYFASQSWPFPHQLMIGFHAEYDSGEIRIDDDEIVDARWWHYSALPLTPTKAAMSGMLIADYINRLTGQATTD